jgi:hypothetical protein
VTVRADIRDGMQAPAATAQMDPQLDALRASLPPGFRIEAGGATEESAKGENSIKAVMPLMLVGVVTLLMIQLQNVGRTLLVLLTAPLGLIGVAGAAALPGALRFRRQPRRDRAVRNDHAQLGDPGRPDRTGRERPASRPGRRSSARPCAASGRSC